MSKTRTIGTAPVSVRLDDHSFALNGTLPTPLGTWLIAGLGGALRDHGFHHVAQPGPEVHVVLHPVDPDRARPYRRKSAPTFVVAVADVGGEPHDVLRAGYPLLVRALANLAVLVSDGPDGRAVHFVTLEQGTYTVRHDGDDRAFFEAVFERVEPLATSQLVIANDVVDDLPPELHDGDEHTRQIGRAGERLAALELLPNPFPIEDILSERDLRHVKLLYGLGGLSYGNLSARRTVDGPLGPEYWMSASGVDKSHLREIGRDILLVKGYDEQRTTMVLSVPPGIEARRVSVDAIEHWMIYREHPEVGAIVHVHAWIEGTTATEINYPCGTVELASSVAELVRRAPDPTRAVVGQRNHGLTITGHSLDEIFERTEGKIVRNVPMD